MIELIDNYKSFLQTGKLPPCPEKYCPFKDPALAARFPLDKKEYDRSKCIVIEQQSDKFGALLNMTGGCPMLVNGINFRTVEHLYQCTRHPHNAELQRRIIGMPSPLIMKRFSKPHRKDGRQDWYQVKVKIMEWCLHAKLACNYDRFGSVLDATDGKVIVETSPDGDFWGGLPKDKTDPNSPLVGCNIFGKLLMDLRREYRTRPEEDMLIVVPPSVADMLLFDLPVENIDRR
jgi:ribA/ribD-fused uncharacterized protein